MLKHLRMDPVLYNSVQVLHFLNMIIAIWLSQRRSLLLKDPCWDFPDGPVVQILPSNAKGGGSILGHGPKIPHASGAKNPKHQTDVTL